MSQNNTYILIGVAVIVVLGAIWYFYSGGGTTAPTPVKAPTQQQTPAKK